MFFWLLLELTPYEEYRRRLNHPPNKRMKNRIIIHLCKYVAGILVLFLIDNNTEVVPQPVTTLFWPVLTASVGMSMGATNRPKFKALSSWSRYICTINIYHVEYVLKNWISFLIQPYFKKGNIVCLRHAVVGRMLDVAHHGSRLNVGSYWIWQAVNSCHDPKATSAGSV